MDKVALSSVLETERLMPTRLGTELALFIEYKKKIIAGSIDICGYRGANNNISVISDYKFTREYHQVSVEAQLNLYNYMLKKNNGNVVNGKLIKWDNDLVELHPIHNGELKNSILWSDEEVERMLDCLIEGKQFYKNYVLPKDIDVVDLQEQPLSAKNHLLQSGHFNALPSSLSLLHLKQRKYFPLSPPHKLQAITTLLFCYLFFIVSFFLI
jgi:hypothetical protein